MSSHYRDSLLRKLTRSDKPDTSQTVVDNKNMVKSQNYFEPYAGKIIRNVYYRQLNVFGPQDINDTTFTTKMKLIRFANKLHYDTRIWAIRQALFFHPSDTVNAYELADNERYLRNRPYIEDARIYIRNPNANSDSIDILVVTKDLFEYGADVSRFSPSGVGAKVYNKNLLGAAQDLQVGFLWDKNNHPSWNGMAQYTKYNLLGSFADVTVGLSTLNASPRLDTNVYEGSYYVDVERPLYTTSAKLAGGLTLSSNFSMNIHNMDDSLYRDYRYAVTDAWIGYNFLNQYTKDGSVKGRPNIAFLLRQYNLFFQTKPEQEKFADDPVYNNRRFFISQFTIFHQDFFKTTHFFGFGRTEDIPLGYSMSLSAGMEDWLGIQRAYSGIELQKFWPTKLKGLLNTNIGLSSFWFQGKSEDAVIHASTDYYSRLLHFNKGYLRQFFSFDYLNDPNPQIYKPLNINRENGIWGYKNTMINGYQRLNVRAQTVYYSPLKFYGFKFNFLADLQASILSNKHTALFRNPIYTGVGLGCQIRNENLPVNTLKISANYYPGAPPGMKGYFFELTTITNIRFNIYALQKPEFQAFQ